MIKAYCDKIEFFVEEDLSKENILFRENYVWVSNIEAIAIENLTTKTPLEGLSSNDLKNECCFLIPSNNLSCIKWNFKYISNIFENEINLRNFKSLLLKTEIIIELSSIKDLALLNERKEYFPEHSKLAIDFSDTKNKKVLI